MKIIQKSTKKIIMKNPKILVKICGVTACDGYEASHIWRRSHYSGGSSCLNRLKSTLNKEASFMPETMTHVSKYTRSHIKENLKLGNHC